MSNKAINYVWDTPYSGSQKLMLVAIADQCNDQGFCFPGMTTLAQKCGIENRSAQRLITKLEELGEIAVDVNGGIETSNGSTNMYYMPKYRESVGIETEALPLRGVQKDTSPGKGVNTRLMKDVSKVTGQDVSLMTGQDVSKVTPKPSVEPSVEPMIKEKEFSPPEKSVGEDAPDSVPFNGGATPDIEPPIAPIEDIDEAIYGAVGEAKDELKPDWDDMLAAITESLSSRTMKITKAAARNYVNMLWGRSKTGKWRDNNITGDPVTPDELRRAAAWYRRENNGLIPQAADKVSGMILAYRDFISKRQIIPATIPPATPATLPTASDGVIHLPAPLKPTGTEG